MVEVMDVITAIWVTSIISSLMTGFIAWQAFRLGHIMNSSFGKWEAVGWFVMILYRLYGLWTLSEEIEAARAVGYIVDSLKTSHWVNILGNLLFLVIIIYSKHLKRRRIKQSWGV